MKPEASSDSRYSWFKALAVGSTFVPDSRWLVQAIAYIVVYIYIVYIYILYNIHTFFPTFWSLKSIQIPATAAPLPGNGLGIAAAPAVKTSPRDESLDLPGALRPRNPSLSEAILW